MVGIHLSRRTKTWINGVGLAVWLTGAAWLIAHYFFKPAGGFELQVSRAETWWLKLHGAAAFLALWTGGMLWSLHVIKAWNSRRQRWSGGSLFALFLILIVTGYLLYYVGDDRARTVASGVHWVLGLAIPVAYLIHRLVKTRRSRRIHHRA